MSNEGEDLAIEKCKKLVEAKLGWGTSDHWTKTDFDLLSEKIQEATSINLSVTTLRRIWGKVKYESKPTITTLNTLAQFLGFENWKTLAIQDTSISRNGNGSVYDIPATPQIHTPPMESNSLTRKTKIIYLWIAFALVTIIAGLSYFILTRNPRLTALNKNDFQFSSKKIVAAGVPNTVIFEYNALVALPSDSIFIQQSWDTRLRQQVSREASKHTSIYYRPGFFQAKLVVEGQVVKEHDLLIKTDGWIGMIDRDPVPLYLDHLNLRAGELTVPIEELKNLEVSFEPIVPWVSFWNIQEFDVKSDNFIFEAELKNEYQQNSGKCQKTEILLLNKSSAIKIPLATFGCVSDLSGFFFDTKINGKTSDLSRLGCDFSKWLTVRCEVMNKRVKVFINSQKAIETSFTGEASNLVGIIFKFQGTGSVNSTRLLKVTGETVFEDHF